MTDKVKLSALNNIGRPVYRTRKGDFSKKKIREFFGIVENEVSVMSDDGETRYEAQQIRTPTDGFSVRICYHTLESRIRAGSKRFRIAFGQFAPIMPQPLYLQLQDMTREAFKGMRFEDC